MSPEKGKPCFQHKGCEFGQRSAEHPGSSEPAGSHRHGEKLVVPRVVPARDVW